LKVHLLYFASLRDRAGCAEESIETGVSTAGDLYVDIAKRHGFSFAPERLRVAVNGALVPWSHAIADGDEVVFLPPVSGG
jgi:molybdopterin converting factor subunit 1